jgi:hypothetical protein
VKHLFEQGDLIPWSPDRLTVQEGNPHKLTKKPHNFPRKAISRFAGADGRMLVKFKNGWPAKRYQPTSELFTVPRHWDQRTENLSTKLFEEPFQNLVDHLTRQNPTLLTTEEMLICTRMYALWKYRSLLNKNPPQDLVLSCIKAPPSQTGEWTQNEGEQIEKCGA